MKTYKNTILALLVFTASLLINILNINNMGIDIVNVFIATIIDASMLYVYMLLPSKPVAVVGILTIRQIMCLVQDMYLGLSFSEAVNTEGIMLLVLMVALIVQCNLMDIKDERIKDRLIKIITFERKPFKLKLWIQIIIYSFIIVCISSVAKSDSLNILNNDTSVKIMGALAVTLPTIELLAIVTTSTVSYVIIGVYEIIKINTLISLYSVDALNLQTTLYALLQLVVIIYSVIKVIKGREIKRDIKKDKEKDKENVG